MLSRAASLDVEPVYTFRAHIGPVLCLAMSPTGESCYSGGVDGTIRCWNIPNTNIDPYDSFGECCIPCYMQYNNLIHQMSVLRALLNHILAFDNITLFWQEIHLIRGYIL